MFLPSIKPHCSHPCCEYIRNHVHTKVSGWVGTCNDFYGPDNLHGNGLAFGSSYLLLSYTTMSAGQTVILDTSVGSIEIELYTRHAPKYVKLYTPTPWTPSSLTRVWQDMQKLLRACEFLAHPTFITRL